MQGEFEGWVNNPQDYDMDERHADCLRFLAQLIGKQPNQIEAIPQDEPNFPPIPEGELPQWNIHTPKDEFGSRVQSVILKGGNDWFYQWFEDPGSNFYVYACR